MLSKALNKRALSILMIAALVASMFSIAPLQASANAGLEKADGGRSAAVDAAAVSAVPDGHLRVHYQREDAAYSGLGLWIFDDVAAPSVTWPTGATPFVDGQMDSYGIYIDIPLKEDAKKVGLIVLDPVSGAKDGGDKKFPIVSPAMKEVWIKQGSDAVSSFEPAQLPADTVRIHYQRQDGNYDAYGLWLWGDVAEPTANWPTGAKGFPAGQKDAYGAYIDIQMKTKAQKLDFLVLNPKLNGGEKDGGDKGFQLLDRYQHLFIKEGDNRVYVSPYGELATGLVSAEITAPGKLLLGFTMTEGLDEAALASELGIKDKDGKSVSVQEVKITGETTVEVAADFVMEQAPLNLTYSGKTVPAAAGWRMIDEMYAYDGDDLGASYTAGGVQLKLWAPTATSVTAHVYDKQDAAVLIGKTELVKGDQGIWSASLKPGDLGIQDFKGYYYQYEVTNNGVAKKVLDPYAKSMAEFRVNTKGEAGPDGDVVGKAAIVDLSGTSPAGFGFADIPGYEKREDAVIWEIHVRDFTSDPSIENDLHNAGWGSFDAFKQKLDYIKSLGVTHVQLLPVMAWYYGDEAKMKNRELNYSTKDNEYNWGYDPHSYFSPDGAYSADPADPELRVKELKAMIDAIHQADMGVVLDVVYTHMAKSDFLNDIVPNYYAFQDADGKFIGGFGNNLATNRKMAEKLMVDSVKYWFNEYKIDGMRFDMMGDATYGAIQNAYDAAAAINPQALFIGEGWRTFAGQQSDPSLAGQGADQDWMYKTNDVGVFSDEFRNELKSGFGNEGEPRFLTGGVRDIATIFNNIKAQPSNTKHDDPGDMVQYIEAHDNLPLYDIIAQALKKDPAVKENNEEILKRVRLGNLMTLTSQGTAFLHAGQEYGRTKQWLGEGVPEQKYHDLQDDKGATFGYFVHDSYDSSDAINKFDWQKATNAEKYPENVKTRDYTTGLIELRQSSDAFRLGDMALVDSNVTLLPIPEVKAQDVVIAYKNKATDGTNYYVFINADKTARTLTLAQDLREGLVVADSDEAGTEGVKQPSGYALSAGSITVDALTAIIVKTDGAEETIFGSNPDTAAPGTPGGSVEQPGPADDVKTLSEEMLKSASTVQLGAADKEVRIPLHAADILGDKALQLVRDGVGVQLPAALLKALQQLAPAGQTEGAFISFKLNALDTQAAASLAAKAGTLTSAKLTLGSIVYDFDLSVQTKDGKEYKPERFAAPVQLRLATNKGMDGKLAGIYQLSDQGLEYAGGKLDGSVMIASVNHFSHYGVLQYEKSFSDLAGHWAEQAVKELAAKQIVNGVSDTLFSPASQLTRAQFAAMLVRALMLPESGAATGFKDVGKDAWYASAVSAAVQSGLVNGKSAELFAPDAIISRQEMASMLVRAYQSQGQAVEAEGAAPTRTDMDQVAAWAVEKVQTALSLGLMHGHEGGKFAPTSSTTRAESAQALLNLWNQLQK